MFYNKNILLKFFQLTMSKHFGIHILDFFLMHVGPPHSFFKTIYLFYFYFWLCWVFVAAHGLSMQRAGATLSCGALASYSVTSLVAEHWL